MTDQHDPGAKEKRSVLNLYAALGVSLALTLVPSGIVGLVATIFLIAVLIAAYILRRRYEAEGLAENHMTYIIRTLWISALFSLITLTIGSTYLLNGIDYASFQPCANALAEKGIEFAETATFQEMYALTSPCMDDFIDDNFRRLTIAALITALPILLYMVIRYMRGLSRALRGYRVASPKAWF